MMTTRLLFASACLLAASVVHGQGAEKWSRQLEPTVPGAGGLSDSFDWIPLSQAIDNAGSTAATEAVSKDRSANGRVLSYAPTFPSDARFSGGLPPKQQQGAPFDYPYQFQRFLSAPPQNQQLRGGPQKQQEPTSQSFFKFEMPLHNEPNRQAGGPPTVQTGYQIQHTFGGGPQSSFYNSPLFNQQPVFPPEFHPISQKPLQQQLQQKPLPQQNFIEDTLPLKSNYRESKPQPTQQALHGVAPQVFPVDPQPEPIYELNKPASFQAQSPFVQNGPSAGASVPATAPTGQSEGVQLLYVPYDTIYNQQQQQSQGVTQGGYDANKYNLNPGLPAVNPYQINQFYTPDPGAVQQPETNYYSTSTTSRPLTSSLKPNSLYESFLSSPQPQFTTAKPKPKAHQPPLAMFLLRNTARPTQSDVVGTLRTAQTIAVIDAPTKETPSIFVGPAGMPIPNGYVKFDLPYLSQLAQKRDLREVPFFVAPLSYRTPNGFNKILLPEPHVGSIVVNRGKEFATPSQSPQQQQPQPQPTPNDIAQYQGASSPRPRPTQRIKQQQQQTLQSVKDYYPDVVRQSPPPQKPRHHYEVTTQRATLQPGRGNKFNYFYDQDQVIHEVTSPKANKLDRPKKKRPQTVQVEQLNYPQNAFDNFKPLPNQIDSADYYKVTQPKPSSTSTSTSTTTTTTTSTTPAPHTTYFTYNTSPQVEFQSTKGQLYPQLNAVPQATPEDHVPRFTTRPPPLNSADEEFRMKQYFRQQNAFRDRTVAPQSTLSPYEQVQYTPVALDFEQEVKIPSSSTTQRTTTSPAGKQRFTFYSPTATPVTVTAADQFKQFNTVTPQIDNTLPPNHRPAFNQQNEIPDGVAEYDPNPYQLPSELPPLTPNLPGLVNGLQDKDKQLAAYAETSTAAPQTTSEPEQPIRPSRRPLNRVRKPPVTKVTSSVSYSESESTSRRTPQRVRRPYGSRGTSTSPAYGDSEGTTTSTTRRPTSGRNPLIRNPNRIRYQPTPEERQTLRIKTRKHGGTKSEDLEYQRDVLNQNYPVFKPGRKSTSPTAIPSSYATSQGTEAPTSESQQVYTVTPSNVIAGNEPQSDRFPAGLLEPMQIAQQYNEYSKENYGPGYFPNQEDLNPTEPVIRNEINPVYNSISSTTLLATTPASTTTTTEEPQVTTRRSPFVRRNYPRLRTTTTEAPATTSQAPEERHTIRPRIPPRKVIKVRQRTRRPSFHPASSTNAPEDQPEEPEQESRQTSRKVNRYNQDLYENDAIRRRFKSKPHFQLEGQESQWSPALKTVNSHNFKPLNFKDKRPKEEHNYEDEPEIVTASPTAQAQEEEMKPETYEINVSANLGSQPNEPTRTTPNLKAPNLEPEKSFAELLEEVMGKAPVEEPLEPMEPETHTTSGTFFESTRTTVGDRLNRRGKWKKLRVSPVTTPSSDSFETAESQNLGAQLLNSLYANGAKSTKITEELIRDLRTTTAMTPTETTISTTTALFSTTTPTPQTTMDEYDMTTPRQLEQTTMPTTVPMDEYMSTAASTFNAPEGVTAEAATRRHDESYYGPADDLDTQSSLFSEVKKQLHELFAIEEDDRENEQAATGALAAVGRRRQDYTSIKRVKPESTTTSEEVGAVPTTEAASEAGDKKTPFHKNLMQHVVYATSTSTKVSSETEICYRGRCVRSEDLPANHKLN